MFLISPNKDSGIAWIQFLKKEKKEDIGKEPKSCNLCMPERILCSSTHP